MDGLDTILADWQRCRPRGAVLPVEGLTKLQNLTPHLHAELLKARCHLRQGDQVDSDSCVVHFLHFWKVLDELRCHVDEAPLAGELRAFREALLNRLERSGGTISSQFLADAVRRAQRKSADASAWRPLKDVVSSLTATEGTWWGQGSLKLALDELSTLLLPWLQELVEDYSRGSRSAKIFCVKDVAGCRCWDACLYLSRNDWDVEAALQSFYSTKVATQEAVKPAAWSSGGAKLKRKEVDCPICVEKYAPGNKTIMTKCCFQVLCGKCYSRLTDSTGRFSCPFCRGADGLERDDIEEIDPPRLSRYRRMVEALTPPVDMQRLHRCHNGLKQLAPTCLLCVAVVVCNICAVT